MTKAILTIKDTANLNAIILRLEGNERVPCKERFIDKKIILDMDDYQDTKIIRFLDIANVIKCIDFID